MQYLPDPIEIIKFKVDRMVDDLQIEGNTAICPGCEKRKEMSGWNTITPAPHSMSVCGDCIEKLKKQTYTETKVEIDDLPF